MNMTLSRALRYKKRVLESIQKTESDIQLSNSVIIGTEREVDVRQVLANRTAWIKHLLDLKQAIVSATRPVERMILELAEAKAQIVFLKRVPHQSGKVIQYSGDQPLEYNAVIRKSEIDQTVSDLQDQIDKLQTAIDQHNATTMITLECPVLSEGD